MSDRGSSWRRSGAVAGLLALSGWVIAAHAAAGEPPRMCLVMGAELDRAPCRGAAGEVLETNRPVTLPIDVPTTSGAPAVDITIVDPSHPGGRRLVLEPVVRDGAIAERRFVKLAGRDAFRRASGEEAGNYRPRWHASGRYLVWHQIGDLARLWCLDLQAATPEPRSVEFPDEDADELFGEAADGISHFEWIPGTTSMLVRLTRARLLRRVDFDQCRGSVTVAEDWPEATEFAIAPDGKWLVWRPVGSERLLVGPAHGQPIGELCGPRAAPALRQSVCRGVRWHPSGEGVAFWHARGGTGGAQQVVSVPLDTQKRVVGQPRLIEAAATRDTVGARKKPAMAIAYSPSGEQLAFVSGGRIYIVGTSGSAASAPARPLSTGRGRYNSNKSDIVWLDTHHIAAVVDGSGGQHPVAVVHVDPERTPTILSRAFPSHYDLAWDPTQRRLAVSGFAGQQGIWVAPVSTLPDKDQPPAEYYLTVREEGQVPLNLAGPRPRHRYADGLEVNGRWDLTPGTDSARLTLTFVLRKTP